MMIRIPFTILLLTLWATSAFSQTGQIDIGRVSLMPNLPSPYLMRDWKQVGIRYDSIIYSLSATGQYLPLMRLNASSFNYPSLQPILLDSYVGSASHATQAEGINIIPSLVGATLLGLDKSNQNGVDWVLKAKDFFNKTNGELVYLNNASLSSGNDWWYDMMPNVFFYQLYSQYPLTSDFDTQFISVADRWLDAVHAMGGSTLPWTVPYMNYRAFILMTMTPNMSGGGTEPESAGTIAWLLYHAYGQTGEKKYLEGSQLAMTFLSQLSFSPAYEIQMPYGSLTAAKMNAELGTHFDIEKMINWSFDQSAQRNWGTIVGTWGGADVSGLVGEIDNPATGYAFAMNGFQQAAALVPLVKYDKRFARTIAKWTLNMANASRLFYSQYLPATNQDDFVWSSAHDAHSVIAYEALKQVSLGTPIPLFATGDAKRNGWAQTNLGIYGSSHVGYMAALIEKTDVNGILLLDMNKTDFFGQNVFPSYLLYNPGATTSVTLPLGASTYDIYDAISETILYTGATGNYAVAAAANEVLFLVYLPSGSIPVLNNGKLMLGNDVVDYHYGYDFSPKLHIRSLASADTLVEFNKQETVYSSIENKAGPATFNWYINGGLAFSSPDSVYVWNVPSLAGQYNLVLEVISGAETVKDSLSFHVVDHIPVPPLVTGISMDSIWYSAGKTATLICHASNPDGSKVQYNWSTPSGTILDQNDSLIHWRAPLTEGLIQISCEVINHDALSTIALQPVLVKLKSTGTTSPFAYYPFDGDVLDYSGNNRHGVLTGGQLTADAEGLEGKAYSFSSGAFVYVNNDAALNFQNQITVSFWLKIDGLSQEAYVVSHGSYEQRWKVSVLSTGKLRWTVKTDASTKDLDSSLPLTIGTYYHVAVVYTGYAMELYIDGTLDTFVADNGLISQANKELTFGRKDVSTSNYHLNGSLDEVRIYDVALAPNEIATLKDIWLITTALQESSSKILVYPNPAHSAVQIQGVGEALTGVTVYELTGRKIEVTQTHPDSLNSIRIELPPLLSGLLILRIETPTGVIFRKLVVY